MPQYFFHTRDGGEHIDPEGVELADHGAARIEAIRYAGALMRDEPEAVLTGRDFLVFVEDENEAAVMTVIVLGIEHH